MKKKYRRLFSPWDALVVLGVAAVALCGTALFFFSSSECLTLSIKINGELWKQVELSPDTNEDIALENGDHHAFVHIEKGEVCFTYSDCPDKLCVNQGKISKAGQSIVCLPGRFSLLIEPSGGESDGVTEGLDAVVH